MRQRKRRKPRKCNAKKFMYTQLNLKRIEVFIGSQSVDCYKRFNISKDGMRAKTPMLQL